MDTPLSEESLLGRARNGDADAFCEFVEPYEARLYRQAWNMCRDPHQAEDLVQEVLLEAWKSLERYDENCRFPAWLYAILTHRFKKLLRKRLRTPRIVRTEGAEPESDGDRDPSAPVLRKEESEAIREALHALPDGLREAVSLRFFETSSLKDIAAVLDIPLGTVKSRLHNALERLQEHLDFP
jgi:RNA polymerase sigma-70 factor (ECF subfamily)